MTEEKKVTLSVIKADVGSLAGHHVVHPDLIEVAYTQLKEAKGKGIINDFYVTNVGDDLQLIMLHKRGENDEKIHELAWNTFMKAADKAKELHLYGAGQDLLSDAFSGNVKGMGPGVAELEIKLRPSEPVVVFMADKTEPSAFNLPLFRIFADPFNTAGLVIDPKMHGEDLEHTGFKFKVLNVYEGVSVVLKTPEEMYDLLALIGSTDTYSIERIWRYDDEPAAAVSTTKLALIAHKYVGKDDPVAIVRAQSGFPALGEILEPFAFPFSVAGGMRGSHFMPLMPCPQPKARPSRFDGPPRIVALGFNLTEDRLIGPSDLFDDPSFDLARDIANQITTYFRLHGPFMPHRLGEKEMEYTTLPLVLKKLKDRLKKEK
ncbi:MAG: fructose 1,6-bisphosphatase [Candidatus Odinarchaeota archaeon]|nr:fructose 1,6-bisphosphatase [Candidatus Odinarchaeota archaeon]